MHHDHAEDERNGEHQHLDGLHLEAGALEIRADWAWPVYLPFCMPFMFGEPRGVETIDEIGKEIEGPTQRQNEKVAEMNKVIVHG